MIEFIIFDIFCWFGLCALIVFFIYQKRKKTLLLRTFVRMAKNQSPEKWTATESAEGLPREYSTKIAGFCLVIGKYPKKDNGNGVICYSYRMFISRENGADAIFSGSRITRTYKQVDGARRKTEKTIDKWRRLSAKVKKKDVLAPA